jgi:hypothetical protein
VPLSPRGSHDARITTAHCAGRRLRRRRAASTTCIRSAGSKSKDHSLERPAPGSPPPLKKVVMGQTRWEDLDSWITPNDKFFSIAHYDRPVKSAPARVTLRDGRYQIDGMAWGPAPIAAVDVKIDNGPWMKATLDDSRSEFSWRPWHLDWSPAPGEHTITSRAVDKAGNIQPTMDDASIANKKTYWESNGQITRQVRIS